MKPKTSQLKCQLVGVKCIALFALFLYHELLMPFIKDYASACRDSEMRWVPRYVFPFGLVLIILGFAARGCEKLENESDGKNEHADLQSIPLVKRQSHGAQNNLVGLDNLAEGMGIKPYEKRPNEVQKQAK